MQLVEFVLQRIAEDEAVARAAGNFKAYRDDLRRTYLERDGGERVTVSADSLAEAEWWTHAVKHLPGRVLAGCEAKRRIVEHCRFDHLTLSPGDPYVLQLLALPYADHEDFREEWKP